MNWKALTKTAKRTLSRNSSKILLGLSFMCRSPKQPPVFE